MRRVEQVAIVTAVIALVIVPIAIHGWPRTPAGNGFVALLTAGGLSLLWWRTRPRMASVVALGSILGAVALDRGAWFPDPASGLFSAAFAVLALAWSGRSAWVAAAGAAIYLLPFYALSDMGSWVATLLFTVPPYAAGTALRLREETADQLAVRARELEDERELFAELVQRHERARIASELHDIVGHAISVMVIQAAAGQRLVDVDPERAKAAFTAIAESARQGNEDLQRLVELLGGSDVGGPDLSLVDEVVARASGSGLQVTCRFVGDRDGVPAPVAHLAFRVVQESLTNALRHAPGAEVRVAISVGEGGRSMEVRVENDHAPAGAPSSRSVIGTGRGLTGLRERIQVLGGHLVAGPTRSGGWAVEAHLPG